MIKWDHTFKLKRVFRQDDPLSPILFNIVVDMLAIIVSRAKEHGQVKWVVPNLIDGTKVEALEGLHGVSGDRGCVCVCVGGWEAGFVPELICRRNEKTEGDWICP